MDDKTTSSPDMPEYKFAESEGIPADATANSDSGSIGARVPLRPGFNIKNVVENIIGNINWHKLIVPGAIVFAILLVYGIISFFSAKKTNEAEQKKAQAQEVVATQQDMISTSSPAVVVQTQPPPTLLNNNQIEQIQATVQQKISAVENEISGSRDQFLSLESAISKAQQDISSVSQNVNQLTVAMQQLLGEVQQLKAPKIKAKNKIVKPLAIYHIRAIVPGRVWLESDDGKSVTLRVGDRLEGYGTVDVISPREGMVVMSSGSYFQYGVNDF